MRNMEYVSSFITVIKEGSFAKAAIKLNLTSAAVGKQIKVLEEGLGHQLIHRMPSGITLTEAGEVFHEHALNIADACLRAESALQNMRGKPKGLLRVAMNVSFGNRVLVPAVSKFLEMYPDVKVELVLTDGYPNLEKESIDMLFDFSLSASIAALELTDLVCKNIRETRLVFCAAPSYLANSGRIEVPEDMKRHRYIAHSSRDPDDVLEFKDGNMIRVEPYIRIDNTHGMSKLATTGVGIALLQSHEVVHLLEAGTLVEVLAEHNSYTLMTSVYYRKTSHPIPKIQAFIDFMLKVCNPPREQSQD